MGTDGNSPAFVGFNTSLVKGADVGTDLDRYTALHELNQLSRDTMFVKFVLDDGGDFSARIELLIADLQHSEVVNAIDRLGYAASLCDEALAHRVGGMTYQQWLESYSRGGADISHSLEPLLMRQATRAANESGERARRRASERHRDA